MQRRTWSIGGGFVAAAVLTVGLAVANAQTSANRALGATADDYPEGQACASGIAISVTAGHVCSETCTSHSDCPTAWGCKSVPQGNGETRPGSVFR